MRTIYFDLDGTLANLYGVEGWLDDLINERTRPYEIAEPLISFSLLARFLNRLQTYGYQLGVISWLAKNSNENYDLAVTETKMKYLEKHLPSVNWNEIHIVKYGTPKYIFANENDILFDDEKPNREKWIENGGVAFDVDNIIFELKNLMVA